MTADSITLGYLTDLSGVFAPLAKPIVQGTQQYWKQEGGKVCDRTVKFVTKDHGYDPQKAVVQYRDLQSKVAGLQQLLGSPITAAILPSLESNPTVLLLAAWAVVPAVQRLHHRDRCLVRHRDDQRPVQAAP